MTRQRFQLFALLLLAGLTSQPEAGAQSPAPVVAVALAPFHEVSAMIEASGAAYPRAAISPRTDRARRCVNVAKQPASSGEFSVRGFDQYASTWAYGGKLSWWPQYPRRGDTLVVRVINAERPADTTIFRFNGPVRLGGMDTSVVMYPSGVHVPGPGPWFLVATAGPNWGCFLYRLPG